MKEILWIKSTKFASNENHDYTLYTPKEIVDYRRFALPAGIAFSLLKKEKDCLKQALSWFTCREGFANNFVIRLKADKNPRPQDYKMILGMYTTITNKKLGPKEIAKKCMANRDPVMKEIVRVLNMFEEKAGWKKTTAYCTHDCEEQMAHGKIILILNHSSKWLASTQLISLFGLVIRLARKNTFTSCQNIDDVRNLRDDMLKNQATICKGYSDGGYFARTFDYWIEMMNAYDDIFFPAIRSYVAAGEKDDDKGVHYGAGIEGLIKGTSQKNIKTKWAELMRELQKKKKEAQKNASKSSGTGSVAKNKTV